MIYTVFPMNGIDMPQDFESYEEAKRYGEEEFGPGEYEIESPCE